MEHWLTENMLGFAVIWLVSQVEPPSEKSWLVLVGAMELLRFQNSFYSFNLLSLIKLESQRVWISCGILCVCLLVDTCPFTWLWRPEVDGFWVPSSGTTFPPPHTSPRLPHWAWSFLIGLCGQWAPGTPVPVSSAPALEVCSITTWLFIQMLGDQNSGPKLVCLPIDCPQPLKAHFWQVLCLL